MIVIGKYNKTEYSISAQDIAYCEETPEGCEIYFNAGHRLESLSVDASVAEIDRLRLEELNAEGS